jgi:hypothetical protein
MSCKSKPAGMPGIPTLCDGILHINRTQEKGRTENDYAARKKWITPNAWLQVAVVRQRHHSQNSLRVKLDHPVERLAAMHMLFRSSTRI